MKAYNPWQKPSALQLAVKELENSLRCRLEAKTRAEYYVALETMFVQRIQRLRKDISQLKEEPK